MKKSLLIFLVFLSTSSFSGSATHTTTSLKSWMNLQAEGIVKILNQAFTKLNITSCDQLVQNRVDYVSINVHLEGNNTDAIYNNLKFVWLTPSIIGMAKRVELHLTNSPSWDTAIEFSCEKTSDGFLSKAYLVNRGVSGNDIAESYWNYSVKNNPEKKIRVVGSYNGDAMLTHVNGVTKAHTSDASDISMDYSNLLQYLLELSSNYRGPSCPTGIEIGPCEIVD